MKKLHFETVLDEFPLFHAPFSLANANDLKHPLAVTGAIERLLKENFPHGILSRDRKTVLSGHFGAYWAYFCTNGKPIYKMAHEFSKELSKVKLDIPVTNIPYNLHLFCVEFPDGIRFNMGPSEQSATDLYAQCVYIFTTDEKATAGNTGRESQRYVQFTIPLYDEDGNLTREVQEFGIPITSLEMTFSDAVAQCVKYSTVSLNNMDFVNFCFNCLVYINSGDPDLRHMRAPKPPTTHKPKKLRLWAKNHCTLDVTHVGFNFKKPVTFSVDETTVMGHFRWQPHGEGRKEVKLIWIDAHKRTYNKEVASEM